MISIICFIVFLVCFAKLLAYAFRVLRYGKGLLLPNFAEAFDIMEQKDDYFHSPVSFWGKTGFIAAYYLTLLMLLGVIATIVLILLEYIR